VKLTTHLHLVPRSRIVELYIHSFLRLLGVFNYAQGQLFVYICRQRERERETRNQGRRNKGEIE
jgi:hypothetical protein